MKGFRRSRPKAAIVAGLVVVAFAAGVAALFTEAQAAPRCICPQVWAPVVCDNGRTYPNQCFADCRHAKNCVPADIF